MSLKAKAIRMRNAIDAMDLALHGDNDLQRMRKLFEDARDEMKIDVTMTAQNIRQICHALDECNEIANSPEFIPANLSN